MEGERALPFAAIQTVGSHCQLFHENPGLPRFLARPLDGRLSYEEAAAITMVTSRNIIVLEIQETRMNTTTDMNLQIDTTTMIETEITMGNKQETTMKQINDIMTITTIEGREAELVPTEETATWLLPLYPACPT